MDTIYDHYIAIDWSRINMAIARMTKKSNKIAVFDASSDIAELKFYLKSLKGTKILTIEESTTSQWLYTELKDYVDRIFICDPYRNSLLKEGPKTDMKEVYHSSDIFLYLRKLVGGYEDLIKAGVRVQNQRYSLLRACGKDGSEEDVTLGNREERFVLECLDRQIEAYQTEKNRYEKEFKRLARKYPAIRHQKSLPGIGHINAVKIVARVVTPFRFARNGHYLSYLGLIRHEKISGGRSYGKKKSRYCRMLKSVYKQGVQAAIGGNNPINDYYEYLIQEKNYPPHNARHKACRRLAVLSLGVFKSEKRYNPYRRDNVKDYN